MTTEIQLSQGKIALIDDADYASVAQFKWCATQVRGRFKAVRSRPSDGLSQYLARFIMRPPDGMYVDHINGDELDNRRANLRICTPQENSRNARKHRNNARTRSCHYKGVMKVVRPYRARIMVEGKNINLGFYVTAEEAAQAYDEAARKHFGEFATVNFPRAGEQPAHRSECQSATTS